MRYYQCSSILFSFTSFPELHRAVPLLQTCSTSEFLYNHACFFLCMFIFGPCLKSQFSSFLCSVLQTQQLSLSFQEPQMLLCLVNYSCALIPMEDLTPYASKFKNIQIPYIK
jgi:hypothetical protein